jgi:hypothetical protein
MPSTRLTLLSAAALSVSAPLTELAAQSPTELKLARALRIDAAENDLTRITPPGDMAVAPNGTIAVSQNQDGALRFFDARGRSLGAFGRKGQGPGEFMTIVRFTWSGDTLVIADGTTRRFTLVSPDRKLVRTSPWLANVSMAPKSGDDAPRLRVSLPQARYTDGSQLVSVTLATGSAAPDWPGGGKPGVPFVRVDSLGVFQRLIAWSPRVQCLEPYDAGAGIGSGNMLIPFCAQALEEAAPNGSRFVLAFADRTSTPAFRVLALGQNGDTLFDRRLPYNRVAISNNVRDSARASRARGSQAQRDAAARMQIPAWYPPVSRLLVGRDETTWLELYGAGGEKSWLLLDGRGTPLGRVVVPNSVRLMVVARDSAWGIETDTDGLQHIVRYRVSR